MLVSCSCNYTTEAQTRQGFRASASFNRVSRVSLCGLVQRKPPENLGHKIPREYRGGERHEENLSFGDIPVVNTATPGCTRVFDSAGYHSLRLLLPEEPRVGRIDTDCSGMLQ